MKRLPWILAILHAAFAALIFGLAFTSNVRAGLPILITVADYPASILATWLCELVGDSLGSTATMTIDCLIYMSIGSIWFYFVGCLIIKVVRKATKNRKQVTH
jgi:hypothetical protein